MLATGTLQKVAKEDWRETNPPQFPEHLKYLPGFFGHGEGEIWNLMLYTLCTPPLCRQHT